MSDSKTKEFFVELLTLLQNCEADHIEFLTKEYTDALTESLDSEPFSRLCELISQDYVEDLTQAKDIADTSSAFYRIVYVAFLVGAGVGFFTFNQTEHELLKQMYAQEKRTGN